MSRNSMGEQSADYDAGDIAVVEGRVAVYMPTRWEWLDGTWTAIPLNVGPVLGNVYAVAEAAPPEPCQACREGVPAEIATCTCPIPPRSTDAGSTC